MARKSADLKRIAEAAADRAKALQKHADEVCAAIEAVFGAGRAGEASGSYVVRLGGRIFEEAESGRLKECRSTIDAAATLFIESFIADAGHALANEMQLIWRMRPAIRYAPGSGYAFTARYGFEQPERRTT